jgi:protein phosphatase
MISLPNSDIQTAHGSHAGESGKNNEDHHALLFFRPEPDDGERLTVGIIADGIGGNRAGEVASELAVKTLSEAIAQSEARDGRVLLESAMRYTARVVAEHAKSRLEYHGMGTTCAIALLLGRRLYTAYIGDSRVYLCQRGVIRQISVDHTWVQEAMEMKLLTLVEAKQHPNRHVVRRHLGGSPDVKADFRLRLADDETAEQSEKNQGLRLGPGDTVLLCSDGLSDLVEREEIGEVLNRHDPQGAVDELIVMARARGGHDNITVVVMRLPG